MRGINYIALIARLPAKLERKSRVDPEITDNNKKSRII